MRRATALLGFALTALPALGLLAACSSPRAPAAAPAPAGPTNVSNDPVELCKALYARQYECRSELIPAIVDLRVRHDQPPGIAAAAATPDGRKEIIDMALKEFETEGIEPKRSAICQAKAPGMPGTLVTAAKLCLGQPDCAGLVGCLIPLQESRLSSRAAR